MFLNWFGVDYWVRGQGLQSMSSVTRPEVYLHAPYTLSASGMAEFLVHAEPLADGEVLNTRRQAWFTSRDNMVES